MYDVVIKKFTFVILSADEFLVLRDVIGSSMKGIMPSEVAFSANCPKVKKQQKIERDHGLQIEGDALNLLHSRILNECLNLYFLAQLPTYLPPVRHSTPSSTRKFCLYHLPVWATCSILIDRR